MDPVEQSTGQALAAAGEQIESDELNAAQAALSAAASEVVAEIHAEQAQAAAQVATAAAMDSGKLDAILEGIGRIEGHMAIISAAPAQPQEAAAEAAQDAAAAVADVVAELEEVEAAPDPDLEPEADTAEIETAGSVPPGRKRRPGLMRRKRSGRGA